MSEQTNSTPALPRALAAEQRKPGLMRGGLVKPAAWRGQLELWVHGAIDVYPITLPIEETLEVLRRADHRRLLRRVGRGFSGVVRQAEVRDLTVAEAGSAAVAALIIAPRRERRRAIDALRAGKAIAIAAGHGMFSVTHIDESSLGGPSAAGEQIALLCMPAEGVA